jgi:hypothetical protein
MRPGSTFLADGYHDARGLLRRTGFLVDRKPQPLAEDLVKIGTTAAPEAISITTSTFTAPGRNGHYATLAALRAPSFTFLAPIVRLDANKVSSKFPTPLVGLID